MLYADGLVPTGESRQEVDELFVRWNEKLEIGGLKVNIGKAKLLVSCASSPEPLQLGRYHSL